MTHTQYAIVCVFSRMVGLVARTFEKYRCCNFVSVLFHFYFTCTSRLSKRE